MPADPKQPKRRLPAGPVPDRFYIDDAAAVRFGGDDAEGEPPPPAEGDASPLTESEIRDILGE